METYTYRIIIESDENGTFHGYVPALRGCHTWGKTLAATRENIKDAIDVYLRSLRADGEIIPQDNGIEILETVKISPIKKSPIYA
ncbi:MAG: type II toxin-antitoxin system HicB family antitoxin [Patescibacteria group bacterium]